jgi:DNA-binding CsgD family transcriptional regulator
MLNDNKDFATLYDYFPNLMIWEKNQNSLFKSANLMACQLLGLKKSEDICGLSDYDLPCRAAELAEIWQQDDKQVMFTARSMQFFEIVHSQTSFNLLLVTKIPQLDQQKNLIGTYGYAVDVTEPYAKISRILTRHLNQRKNALFQDRYIIGQKPGFDLTGRQSECLFFTLRGKTCKEIGKILNLSPRTIECYMEELKAKFNCKTRNELIDKAISQGFLYVIPQHLFNQQLSILIA